MAGFTAPLFVGDEFLLRCLNGQAVMGDRETDEAPVDSVQRVQTAMLLLGLDVGSAGADGLWGDDTESAVLAFKTALDIRTDDGFLDGFVGRKTMTALEAIFGFARFDEAAVAVMDLGFRAGDQIDQGGGVVTVAYERGIVACADWAATWPIPAPLSDQWLALGGPLGVAGLPAGDPFVLLDAASAQAFRDAGLVGTIAGEVVAVPLEVLGELQTGIAGPPVAQPAPLVEDGDVMALAGTQGAVLWGADAPAVAVPQPIVDRCATEALAGNPLGPPAGRAFVEPGGLAFPFALGTLLLADIGGIERTAPAPASLDRFHLPADPGRRFDAALDGSAVHPLVGGPAFFASMAADFARVKPGGFVYLASWNCQIDLPCFSGGGTLRGELTRLSNQGTEVRMQLWAATPISGAIGPLRFHPAVGLAVNLIQAQSIKPRTNNLGAVAAVNAMTNGFAFLDDRHATFGSHHQKVVVLHTGTELVAYVGGIEFTDDRISPVSHGAPLFDVSVRIAGPGALAVLNTYAARWHAHPTGAGFPLGRLGLPVSAVPVGPVRVQVGHTYAAKFPFPGAVGTASELTANAILSARTYFYMEDQYYVGDPRLDSAIRAALNKGVTGIVVIAAEDSVSDLPDVGFRRRRFVEPITLAHPGRFLVFEAVGDDGTSTGQHAYVHSKLTLVDDEAFVIGSMNSSRRSWNHDSEVMAALVDLNGPGGAASGAPGLAKAVRIDLWSRHLKGIGLPTVPIDPLPASLAAWTAAAAGVPGLSVRPYPPAGSVAHRPPLRPNILDYYWDAFADPT